MAMYLAIVTCVLVTVVFRLAWPALAESVYAEKAGPERDPVPAGSHPATPQSLEGALAAQLVDRVITGDQYRRAMEFVAAREVARRSGPRSPS
jgi:hypothetical protein